MSSSTSEDPSFFRALCQLFFGLTVMAVSLFFLVVSLGLLICILALLIGTPLAILISWLSGVPIGDVPLLGGIATLGILVFEIMWRISEILSTLLMVVLAVVLFYAMFVGGFDEWIDDASNTGSREDRSGKRTKSTKKKRGRNDGSSSKKPRRKRRL